MGKLKTSLTVYNWVFKFIGAILLITLAIILTVMDVESVVEAFVGLLIAGYAIMRLVPFIKTQRSDLIKTINIFEIFVNLIVALIFIGNMFVNDEPLGAIFGYMLGGVLILRGMVHFYGISDGNEKGDHPTYFFHIATLIIGTLIIVQGYTVEQLIILMLILTIGASVYLGVDAYGGYNLYRRRKQMEAPRDETHDQPKDMPVPRKEDPDKERDQIVS